MCVLTSTWKHWKQLSTHIYAIYRVLDEVTRTLSTCQYTRKIIRRLIFIRSGRDYLESGLNF